MKSTAPSRTARAAAIHRAAHQLLDHGAIFSDPLALRILGPDAQSAIADSEHRVGSSLLRLFIAIRTRFAEDHLAEAVGNGATQLVVLGAGLDTYAYRNPFAERLAVFEVDHPATQAWKRELLAAANIDIPNSLTFVSIDFERQQLAEQLQVAGFDPTRRTFFTWLGVVPYLTRAAVLEHLAFMGGLPGGAHVVFDYADPPESYAARERGAHAQLAERVAKLGEGFVTYFDPTDLAQQLTRLGYSHQGDLGPVEIRRRYVPQLAGPVQTRGGHVMHAQTRAAAPRRA